MARKHYTEEQIGHALTVLRANGGNVLRTEKALGISRSTLRMWADGKHPKHIDEGKLETVKTDNEKVLADNWERVALASTQAALPKIEDASFKDLLIGAGIATEKLQLLRGKPTSRAETATIVYVQPTALRELAGEVIEGEFRADSGTPALPDGKSA